MRYGGRRRGPFQSGDLVQLSDPSGKRHLIMLQSGATFHTHKGALAHDALLGREEGSVLRSSGGTAYLAFRPTLADYAVAMPRGAAVIYPKDAAQIVAMADIAPGARVVEAGVGSGALTCWLLRAVGETGAVISYERRADFAEVARGNVERFHSGPHPAWRLVVGDFVAALDERDLDQVILDMLAPWECIARSAQALVSGGVICCYVATTMQLARTVEALRAHGEFSEPSAWETLVRHWHCEGMAVRPDHRMVGHTGFLVTARKLAPGSRAPRRRRRPAKGAYGAEWEAFVQPMGGVRPAGEGTTGTGEEEGE